MCVGVECQCYNSVSSFWLQTFYAILPNINNFIDMSVLVVLYQINNYIFLTEITNIECNYVNIIYGENKINLVYVILIWLNLYNTY